MRRAFSGELHGSTQVATTEHKRYRRQYGIKVPTQIVCWWLRTKIKYFLKFSAIADATHADRFTQSPIHAATSKRRRYPFGHQMLELCQTNGPSPTEIAFGEIDSFK
jgi:hypothetical protein